MKTIRTGNESNENSHTDQASLGWVLALDFFQVWGSWTLDPAVRSKCLSYVATGPSPEGQTVPGLVHELTGDFLSVDKTRQDGFIVKL